MSEPAQSIENMFQVLRLSITAGLKAHTRGEVRASILVDEGKIIDWFVEPARLRPVPADRIEK